MKRIAYITMAFAALAALASCEKDLEVYNDPTCRLNFYYDIPSRAAYDTLMSRTSYSFVYGATDRQRDTLWYEVETMGFTADHDRPITIEQVSYGSGQQAVAGQHYVAFDDPTVASAYVIPAGKARTKIPVILLRDASLKSLTVTLRLAIKANADFIQGYPEYAERTILITDQLSEPSQWNYLYIPYPSYPDYSYSFATYFGEWGAVKHQFLISETGKKWDDDYIKALMEGDSNYLTYILRRMSKRLDEVNAERQAQGLDVLREADGTPVVIADPYANM